MRARSKLPFIVPLFVMAVLVGVVGFNVSPASAADNVNCNSPQPGPPFNSWQCPLASYHNTSVYLQSYPEQNEIQCPNGERTRARLHVQMLTRRTTTGFFLQGLWIDYQVGIQRFGWFQATAVDGNGAVISRNVNGQTWSNWGSPYGGWNPDVADRGTTNIARYPAVTPSVPVWIGWGRNNSARLDITLHEQPDVAFRPTNNGCIVPAMHITVIPR